MRALALLLVPFLLFGCVIDDVLGGAAQNVTSEEKPPVKISYSSAHVPPSVSGAEEPEPEELEPVPEPEELPAALYPECEGLSDLNLALCNANHTPEAEEMEYAELYGFNVSCPSLDKSSLQAGILRGSDGSYSWSISFIGQAPPDGALCSGQEAGCFTEVLPGPGATLHGASGSRAAALAEMETALSALYSCPSLAKEPEEAEEEPPDMSSCEGLDDLHRVMCEAGKTQPVPGLESIMLEKLEVPCPSLRQNTITANVQGSADENCNYKWQVNFRGVKPPSSIQCSHFYMATYTTTCYNTLLPDGATLHGCSETRSGALEEVKEAVSLLKTCPE